MPVPGGSCEAPITAYATKRPSALIVGALLRLSGHGGCERADLDELPPQPRELTLEGGEPSLDPGRSGLPIAHRSDG